MKMSEVFFKLLTSKGVDVNKFVEILSFIEAHGMASDIFFYTHLGELEAKVDHLDGCIYLEMNCINFSYYEDDSGDAILWLPNVRIPEIECAKIVDAGKAVGDLIEFDEENVFLKGCGTILNVENGEIGLTVKLLPNWIEIA